MTFTRTIQPTRPISGLALPAETLANLLDAVSNLRTTKCSGAILLTGALADSAAAAEAIAHDTGRELLHVDLTAIASKSIGETEKNLDHVFASTDPSRAILFFDEADALFGKRSDVKDSHDRYANLEISYLLQRIESFCGLAIVATTGPVEPPPDKRFLRSIRLPK